MKVVERNGETRITFQQDLVAGMSTRFREKLADLINSGKTDLVIDFSLVELVDSSGIGVLISAQNTLAKHGKKLVLVNVSDKILHIMKIMRLDRHFKIETGG